MGPGPAGGQGGRQDRRHPGPPDRRRSEASTRPTSAPTSSRKAATPPIEMCKLLEGSATKNVVELVGNVGSSPAIDRGKGFREKMADCGITVTKSQTANWSATEGKDVMAAFLKDSKDIQGVFGQNDEMGLGAAWPSRTPGSSPAMDVKIVTVDATKGAFEAMIAGKINRRRRVQPAARPAGLRGGPQGGQRRGSAGVGAVDRGRSSGRRLPRRTSRRASTRQLDVTVGKRRTAPLPDASNSTPARRVMPCPRLASSCPCAASRRRFRACKPSRAWTSTWHQARSTPSWARTAPASPP